MRRPGIWDRAVTLLTLSLLAGSVPVHAAMTFGFNQIGGTGDGAVPANVQTVANDVGSVFTTLFSNVNVAIDIEWSTGLPSGVVGESQQNLYCFPGCGGTAAYNNYRALLIATQSSADDTTADAHLPAAGTVANFATTLADWRAVGQNTGANHLTGAFDAEITLDANANWSFALPGSGIPAGELDLGSVLEHEIDEVLGTISLVGETFGGLQFTSAADLFRYSGTGTRTLSTSGPAYFSIDGGVTNLVNYNQTGSGDFGDFASVGSCPPDTPRVQNAFVCTGQAPTIANGVEQRLLDVIGYDLGVPEPGTMGVMSLSLAFLAGLRYRRRS